MGLSLSDPAARASAPERPDCRLKHVAGNVLRIESRTRKLTRHGPMIGAEDQIEDRKEGGEVTVEVLGFHGVMDAMILRAVEDNQEPSEVDPKFEVFHEVLHMRQAVVPI